MSILSLLAARSISIFETPACANRSLSLSRSFKILVQQLRVVTAGEPARAPGLVEAEPKPVRMNFLSHNQSPQAFAVFFLRRRPPRLRRRRLLPPAAGFAFGLAPRGRFGASPSGRRHDALRRPLGHRHRQVGGALDDAERAAHRRRADALLRRALVGVARGHEEPLDVAAEAFLLLRVGNRRAQHLLDVARDALAGELERRQRRVHVTAADEVEDEPRLLRRRAHVLRCRVCLHRHYATSLRRRSRWRHRRCLVRLGRVSLERPRRRELAELVPDHVLRQVHRDELLAVVHGERVPDHLGNHRRAARPGLDDLLLAAAVHDLDLLEQRQVDERALF